MIRDKSAVPNRCLPPHQETTPTVTSLDFVIEQAQVSNRLFVQSPVLPWFAVELADFCAEKKFNRIIRITKVQEMELENSIHKDMWNLDGCDFYS